MNIINKLISQQKCKLEKEEYEKISIDIDKATKELEKKVLNYEFQKVLESDDSYSFRQRRNSIKFISETGDVRLGLNLFPKNKGSYEKILKLKVNSINEQQELNYTMISTKEPEFFALFNCLMSFSIDIKSNDSYRIYYILTTNKSYYDTKKFRYLDTSVIDAYYNPNKISLPNNLRIVNNISNYSDFYFNENKILMTKYSIIPDNRIQIFLKEFIDSNYIYDMGIIETREEYEKITKLKIQQLRAITKYFAIPKKALK